MIPPALYGAMFALVVVDWSLIVRQAWCAGGIDACASIVVGRLVKLLSDPMPASMCIAVDPDRLLDDGSTARRWTWRDEATKHLEEKLRYKAGRIPKPIELVQIERRLLEIVRAHRIPILEPANPSAEQDYEADDAAAAAVKLARAEGRPVALVTLDKDWLQLVTDESPRVVRWWPFSRESTDPEQFGGTEVRKKFGVEVNQLCDYLAMVGDTADNVPGVKGIGPKGAAELLAEFGSLDAALEADPGIARPPLGKSLRKLQAQRDNAIGSRSLVRLWEHAPIAWDPSEQMIGGFDVRRLSSLYRDFGFTELARSVPNFAKQPFGDF